MRTNPISRGLIAWIMAMLFAASVSVQAVGNGSAVVRKVSGMAWKITASGVMQPVTAGMVIRKGDTLKTAMDSTVEVALGNESRTVTLASSSTVRVDEMSIRPGVSGDVIQTLLKLDTGSMGASADEFTEGSSFGVEMPNGLVMASFRPRTPQATPQALSAVYNAKTGDIYNFSGSSISLTVVLDIAFSNSSTFPVGLQATSVSIPPGSRFVMPSLFDMDSFAAGTGNFGVSTIPNGISRNLLLVLGFQPMTGNSPIAEYQASVLELKVLFAKKRLGFAKFPPQLTSY